MTSLAPLLQEYFTAYLLGQRAASSATVHTYRDTWRLFLTFLSSQTNKPAHALDQADIDQRAVIAFLDHLEADRHNSIGTRNLRLASIKSVMAFAAPKTPEALGTIARIQAIPVKKQPRPEVAYLTENGVQTLLDAIDTITWTGRRDKAMFTLAAQTGLRISELINLQTTSLQLGDTAPYVECTGKGRKQRTTPLTHATAIGLTTYLAERRTKPGTALFPNPKGTPLSADAITSRLRKHAEHAAAQCPELASKHITVHTLRHTAAMRFLAAGIDASVSALWLGHEQTATTSIYLHADMHIKRQALERTRQPDSLHGEYHPADPLLAWLESL